MGAPGCSSSSSRYIVAIPGTTWRALSARTKVFQAAIIGRGSEVLMTVSSMSLMMPNVSSPPMTCTAASTSSASGELIVDVVPARRQPVVLAPTTSM